MAIADVMQSIQKIDARITLARQDTIRDKKYIRQLQRQHSELTIKLATLHEPDGFTPKDKSDTSGVEFRRPKPVKESTTVMTPTIPLTTGGTSEVTFAGVTEAIEAYCTKCKTKRPVQNGNRVVTKSGKHGLKGTCGTCGSKLFRFIKEN